MGTLNYMAPEQMMGMPDIDARADIFSAGAVYYELLVYKQAFAGGLDTGILHKIINAPPEALLSIDPRLDRAIVALVNKCLQKSRDNRYPDMVAVRRDLAALRRRFEQESAAETMAGVPAQHRRRHTTKAASRPRDPRAANRASRIWLGCGPRTLGHTWTRRRRRSTAPTSPRRSTPASARFS